MTRSTTSAAERELYRYYQPVDEIEDFEFHSEQRSAAIDPCLTAFAQLGALRLNAKRGIISLCTRQDEFVIAEAGKTLSLQQKDDKTDLLWHGVGRLKADEGIGHHLVLEFQKTAARYMVFEDLTESEILKNKSIVTDGRCGRFLACSPLKTAHNSLVIGVFMVVDDSPRDGFSAEEAGFIQDMGRTAMDYLEAERLKSVQRRAEQMVKALGLFVEGKSSLRDWWSNAGPGLQQRPPHQQHLQQDDDLEGRVDVEFGIQDPPDTYSIRGSRDRDKSLKTSNVGTNMSTTVVENIDQRRGISNPSMAVKEKNSRDALFPADVKSVFSRASNLIREATSIEGVIFFDATLGSLGGSSRKEKIGEDVLGEFLADQHLSEIDHHTNSSSDDDAAAKLRQLRLRLSSMKTEDQTSSLLEKTCNIIGYSTRSRSSLNEHLATAAHRGFPEHIMQKLLKRYPHGKVFNFEEDGSFSSSESDGLPLTYDNTPPTAHRAKKRLSREAEAAAILSVVPGARSVAFYPLWDPTREHWFAASVSWSAVPSRILCHIEDMTYIASFANNIMAEINRLAAVAGAHMKNDFISSISHELRSPLHGVLASVELLQDTNLDVVQGDFVSNIYSSGIVLLDIINHVLDFSRVNRKVERSLKHQHERGFEVYGHGKANAIPVPTSVEDVEDVCVLSEEVMNSVYAGRNIGNAYTYTHLLNSQTSKQTDSGPDAISVIVDIAYRKSWVFGVDAGAWRRILMNLFTNALKYTDSGFVKVQLWAEGNSRSNGHGRLTDIFLVISDSGRGISQDFLQHHLYRPFAQEDSLAPGTGLGVSIVRQIVHSLGGDMHFTSKEGLGTTVEVRIPLVPFPSHANESIPETIRQNTKGLRASYIGFDVIGPRPSDSPPNTSPNAINSILSLELSVKTTLSGWFGIQDNTSSDFSTSDLLIIFDTGLDRDSVDEKVQAFSRAHSAGASQSMILILCKSRRSWSWEGDNPKIKITSLEQPFGPIKIANALHGVFTPGPPMFPRSDVSENRTGTPSASQLADVHIPQVTPYSPIGRNDDMKENQYGNPGVDAETSELGQLHVMIVEDNDINLKLLDAYMKKLGVERTSARDGLQALNAYKTAEGKLDIILMDISMPVMSGIESSHHIRVYEEANNLKPCMIIALTGAGNPKTRQEAYACGIDLFLTKPVPLKQLGGLFTEYKVKGRLKK